ncbi:hypothetical protein GCM10023323_77150 [Streptomyces thinghirensis]|uniref:RHS repeat-associated core domain-containing protein n=1 Tax=Streptomyces thinghirensis TaxID=551547 RepID=A0ABP9TGT7_9ACTN
MGGLVNETVVFVYNSDDLPIAIGGSAPYLTDVQYSAFGEILRTDAGPAGKKVYGSYIYDEFTRRLQTATFDRSVAPVRISETKYGYDEAGNITKISDTPGGASPDAGKTDNQCFVYDQLRQMTSAWSAKTDDCTAGPSKDTVGGPEAYWQSYEFDAAGNRTKLVEHDTTGDTAKNVTRAYTYGKTGVGGPSALAEIKSVGPQGERLNTFAYDKAGNTTQRQHGGTTQTLKWDVEGELRKVTEPVEGGGTKATSYLYGADGERLIRTGADGSRTLYLGDAELTVSADNMTKTAERFYAHPDGMTTVRATGGERQLMISDHHGTSHTVVDMADPAMRVTRRKSMPFGEERGQQPSSWPGQRGFVGGTVDQDTGLTRLGARDYAPATGRFISVDPMVDYGNPATMNPYAYSNNAPATFSDPQASSSRSSSASQSGSRPKPQSAQQPAARRPSPHARHPRPPPDAPPHWPASVPSKPPSEPQPRPAEKPHKLNLHELNGSDGGTPEGVPPPNLERFGIDLQPEALLPEASDGIGPCPEPLMGHLRRQRAGRLRRPPQRRHQITMSVRLDQTQQGSPQSGIEVHDAFAYAARPTRELACLQVRQPLPTAVPLTGRPCHCPNTAIPQPSRLRGRQQLPFVLIRE